MGNNATSGSTNKHLNLDEFLKDFYLEFPGMENQIEDAYKSITGCDLDDVVDDVHGNYYMVEPIIRHFVFSMGFAEYMSRFTDSENRLQIDEILPLLKSVGIRFDPRAKLNLDDWKILLVAWTRRLQEEQRHDLEKWKAHLETLQNEQRSRFDQALEEFKKSYLDQIHAYHTAVADHHAQEANYRKQWEDHQSVRTNFKETQLEYVARMNETATKNFRQRLIAAQQSDVVKLLCDETKTMQRDAMEGADKVTSYVYPVTLNRQTGAPVSAGAYVPLHRPTLVERTL